MLKKSTSNKDSYYFLRKPFLFLIVALSLLAISHAQEISDKQKNTIAEILQKQPRTNKELESALKSAQQDTILLNYFLNASRNKKYYLGEAFALNQLGTIYQNLSLFDKAISLHQDGLSKADLADSPELKIHSLNMLSLAYLRKNAIQSALDNAQSALDLVAGLENPSDEIKRSKNVSLNRIGNIYKNLEQWDLAIPRFKEAIALEKKLGNNLGLAINHQDIGESLEAQGKLKEALSSYLTALAYNEKVGLPSINLKSNLGVAHIYVHQDKLEEGLRILESLLAPAIELGNMELISEIYINTGWTFLQLVQYDKAEENLLKGFEIAQNYKLDSEMEEAYVFLSDLSAKKGEYKTSMEYYKKARGIERRTINDRNRRYVADLINRSETEKMNSQLEVLAKENEIVKLKLRKNQTTLLISGFALALLSSILYILFYQRQLKNEKQLLTLEATMLRSQMNPHFLFNSLNSIKLYIINNEKKNAVHYLNKFSKLIRKILEASSVREISLADELETVQLYMNIENIRFNEEIDFDMVIDENVDIHTIKIPSLILQPFLENSLWHGLSAKEGQKSIELRISKENKYFTNITITDNGIGRETSEKNKKNRVIKRKSVGINITKERLANFSKDYQNSFTVDILDLYDDQKRPCGTKISLKIPTI
ncbi:histidine kinase [Sediminicola sp. YIK13]|uniref:tetratricopeptide repeat-containing sensor histidine kinase n=1 Tax=Sediminicola sp. YIK13 TaxID=1453352 RepID=UPI000720ACCA|nr:tetratricopeptide repeat protein [Sediminicola sp. YIK13]ALM08325.1 histidine kinase [Sediminicola sp. YIK13]